VNNGLAIIDAPNNCSSIAARRATIDTRIAGINMIFPPYYYYNGLD